MIFSERQKLSDEYSEWRMKNDVADVAMSVISFLDSRGLICDKSESDAVSRQDAIMHINFALDAEDAVKRVENMPPVTPTRPKGDWVACWLGEKIEYYRCSECDERSDEELDFCPNCGADMREGEA